jgi:hypothetical protein
MKNNIKKILSMVVLFLGPVVISLAQPLPGGDPTTTGGTPVHCPVGPGLWLLLAFGLSYGYTKVMQIRKAAKDV